MSSRKKIRVKPKKPLTKATLKHPIKIFISNNGDITYGRKLWPDHLEAVPFHSTKTLEQALKLIQKHAREKFTTDDHGRRVPSGVHWIQPGWPDQNKEAAIESAKSRFRLE